MAKRTAAAPVLDDDDTANDDTVADITSMPIDDLGPDPDQARDEGADNELADLIKANGFYPSKVIEVREHPLAGEIGDDGTGNNVRYPAYIIVDGERRWRGAK